MQPVLSNLIEFSSQDGNVFLKWRRLIVDGVVNTFVRPANYRVASRWPPSIHLGGTNHRSNEVECLRFACQQ